MKALHNNVKPYFNSNNNINDNIIENDKNNKISKIHNNSYNISSNKNKHTLIASIYFPKNGDFKSSFESEKDNLVDPK